MIEREQIEARLAQLRSDKTELVANVHAINGAIQDCEYWLAQLEETARITGPGATASIENGGNRERRDA